MSVATREPSFYHEPRRLRLASGKRSDARARSTLRMNSMAPSRPRLFGRGPSPAPLPLPRTALLLAFSAVVTAAAWAVFARLPAVPALAGLVPVRIGMSAVDTGVPLGYQVSVFPALGAFAAGLGLDVARGEARRTWLPRTLLLGALCALAIARLAGALPLSGHALFLFGVLAYAVTAPADRDAHVLTALAAPALLVVAWCKLVVWGDPVWFGASAVIGAVAGGVVARIARS